MSLAAYSIASPGPTDPTTLSRNGYELACSRALAHSMLQWRTLPAPTTLRDDEGFVDYSYVNHYVMNDAVLLGSFEDQNDKEAQAILRDCYPDREIVLIDARELFARGGGIHCITQQQPEATLS